MPKEIGKEMILEGLKALGVVSGEKFLVHSGLRMMGWVNGGANVVIDALMSIVTPSGTIMMPAFTFPPAKVFDPQTTPTSLGSIAECFRKKNNVVRSIHPSHSVTVWGVDNKKYTDRHLDSTSLGVGSPVHRLLEDGGNILLLGVGQWANSALHVAESLARVPYLDIPYSEEYANPLNVRMPDGSVKKISPKENPGCSINFVATEAPLKKAGLIKYHRAGDALLQRIDGKGLLNFVCQMLKTNPEALLCSWDLCPFCPRARVAISSND